MTGAPLKKLGFFLLVAAAAFLGFTARVRREAAESPAPLKIAGACGSVGVPKRPSNQPATSGWKPEAIAPAG